MSQGPPEDLTSAAFAIVAPPGVANRFVFASPHSGHDYPDDMAADPAASSASIRSAEDRRVDRLIQVGADLGATLILGRIGRAYVDLNRSPDDLDAALIQEAPTEAGPRAAAGYGVIPRLTGDGRPLYARRLSLHEARDRIARFHAPYHAAVAQCMEAARERHGQAVLVDWHSMPSKAVGGARGVDVVLGDRHGTACSADLSQRLKILFQAQGWSVAMNQPYAGGWTTQTWGRPIDGFHAIQVELSRALYLDEATGEPSRGWARCQAGVARVIQGLLADG